MKTKKYQRTVWLIMGWLVLFVVSCDVIPEEVIRERDLVGTWEYGEATGEVYVGKVNITRVLVVSHGYTQEEAEMLLDSLVSAYLEVETGFSLVLNPDYSYLIDTGGEGDVSGTWSFDEQKDALRLTKGGEQVAKKYTVQDLTRTSMNLRMPDRFEVIDLNEDGKKETNCTIIAEVHMEKAQPVN